MGLTEIPLVAQAEGREGRIGAPEGIEDEPPLEGEVEAGMGDLELEEEVEDSSPSK